jgi:hypothetical protein
MAKNKISEFSSTPANNTDIGGIDIAEGCAPSGINNAIRELMAQLKDQQAGTDADNFTVGGNLVVTGTTTATTLTTTGNTILGDSSADTLNVGGGGLIKDANNRVWVGRSSAVSETNTSINATNLGGIGGQAGSGTGAINTGININQNNGGACLLLLASRNTGAGLLTESAVYVVKFNYDGDNAPTMTYIGGSSNFVTSSIVGSYWYLTNSGAGNVNYSWFINK